MNNSKEELKMEYFVNTIRLILVLIHEEKSSVQKHSSNSVELSENSLTIFIEIYHIKRGCLQ